MPPETDEGKKEVLRGRVTEELKRRAEDYCRRKGMSEATLVRLAVIEYLDLQDSGTYVLNNPAPPYNTKPSSAPPDPKIQAWVDAAAHRIIDKIEDARTQTSGKAPAKKPGARVRKVRPHG